MLEFNGVHYRVCRRIARGDASAFAERLVAAELDAEERDATLVKQRRKIWRRRTRAARGEPNPAADRCPIARARLSRGR